jgi:hypothetical protein
MYRLICTIFEGTSEVQQLIIAPFISGVHIRWSDGTVATRGLGLESLFIEAARRVCAPIAPSGARNSEHATVALVRCRFAGPRPVSCLRTRLVLCSMV